MNKFGRRLWRPAVEYYFSTDRSEKKKAARICVSSHSCAMVCAIADFPEPAGPYIHKTRELAFSSSRTHFIILSRTATRVFGWYFGGSKDCSESWKAAVAVAR